MLLIMNGWRKKKLSYLFGQAHFVEIPYELCYVLCYLLHLLPTSPLPQMGSNGGSNLMDHLPPDVVMKFWVYRFVYRLFKEIPIYIYI